jgi:glycerol-3-phosphate acyltransferase PlsY
MTAATFLSGAGAFLLGYLLGSIPFGFVLTSLAGAPDLRTVGSGNIGATNVLRTGRKGLAAATLLLDALKGTAAVLIVTPFGFYFALAAAVGAFLGHLFPVWLRFRGGKGVATYIGILIGLLWPAAIFFCVVWIVVAVISRYSSLSALIASALTPVFVGYEAGTLPAGLFAVLSIILWIKHRENISRLLAGTEGKIGAQAVPAPVASSEPP